MSYNYGYSACLNRLAPPMLATCTRQGDVLLVHLPHRSFSFKCVVWCCSSCPTTVASRPSPLMRYVSRPLLLCERRHVHWQRVAHYFEVSIAGVLVSTVVPQRPKVISLIAQVDIVSSFSCSPKSGSGMGFPHFPPLSPSLLLPKGVGVAGIKSPMATVRQYPLRFHNFMSIESSQIIQKYLTMHVCENSKHLCPSTIVVIMLLSTRKCCMPAACVCSCSHRKQLQMCPRARRFQARKTRYGCCVTNCAIPNHAMR